MNKRKEVIVTFDEGLIRVVTEQAVYARRLHGLAREKIRIPPVEFVRSSGQFTPFLHDLGRTDYGLDIILEFPKRRRPNGGGFKSRHPLFTLGPPCFVQFAEHLVRDIHPDPGIR